jgi:transcriptional regulator with XRE-family HTH domain
MKALMAGAVARLRDARLDRGLSQAEVAERIGTTQSAVARLESGRSDPRLSTIGRYAEVVGVTVSVDADRKRTPSLEKTAEEIRHSLVEYGADDAFRQVIQFLDDIKSCSAGDVRRATQIEPESTGDKRWDALLAGVAEYASRRARLPVPGWASAPSRFLRRSWFVVEDIIGRPAAGLAVAAFMSSPRELASRGVYIDASSLESV